MSTDSVPTENRTSGSVRARRDTSRDAPSLIAELVFRELVEADAALTEPEIRERTLLPESEVSEALSELDSRGLCSVRRRTTDHAPRRYDARFPPEIGSRQGSS
jgi:transcription initiation factor IIE alpha subunit